MKAPADYPQVVPLLSSVLVNRIHAENEATGERAKAHPTRFRASDAGQCGRKLQFAEMNFPMSNPVDFSGDWVMWLGRVVGEHYAEAMRQVFGDACRTEVRLAYGDLVSGHADVIVDTATHGRLVNELKVRNAYAFDLATGFMRRQWKSDIPQGPNAQTKLQASLYAVMAEADLVVITYLATEAYSKGFSEKVGIPELGRIMGEWHYPKSEFATWASAEIERMERIADFSDHNTLVDPVAIGDEMETIALNPNAAKLAWQCLYCPFLDLCRYCGPGTPEIPHNLA